MISCWLLPQRIHCCGGSEFLLFLEFLDSYIFGFMLLVFLFLNFVFLFFNTLPIFAFLIFLAFA